MVDDKSVEQSANTGLVSLSKILEFQIEESLQYMGTVSLHHKDTVTNIVKKMRDLAVKVSNNEIDVSSAELVLKNYSHALQLYAMAEQSSEKVKAFLEGKRLLEEAQRLLFVLIKVGMRTTSPEVSTVLNAVGEFVK